MDTHKPALRKRRLRWRWILATLIALPLVSGLGLEVLSRVYTCASSTCRSIPVCEDLERFPSDPQRITQLAGLVESYRENGALTDEQTRLAFQEIAVEVAAQDLPALGVYCNGMIYVRSALPGPAKSFVKQHELYHALEPGYSETQATWAAARKYPFGLVSNVLYAVAAAREYYPSFWCYLVGLWLNFKTYLLGWRA
jgi:hypothetical protein